MIKPTTSCIKAQILPAAFILLSVLATFAIPFALAQRSNGEQTQPASVSRFPASRLPQTSSGPGGSNTISPGQMFGFTGTPAGDCVSSYTLALSGSTFMPAATDIGNDCDNCSTTITLPFPVTLYDQTFTTASAGSNGQLTFGTLFNNSGITCWPSTQGTYVLAPYWADQSTTCADCGIFTTTAGTAPNRVFYVEFRTQYFNQSTDLLDYEIALHENGDPPFRFIYSHVVRAPQANDSQLVVGVKRDDTTFTRFISAIRRVGSIRRATSCARADVQNAVP
jgi:hypothetical protein